MVAAYSLFIGLQMLLTMYFLLQKPARSSANLLQRSTGQAYKTGLSDNGPVTFFHGRIRPQRYPLGQSRYMIPCNSYHSQLRFQTTMLFRITAAQKKPGAAIQQINKRGTYGYYESHRRYI